MGSNRGFECGTITWVNGLGLGLVGCKILGNAFSATKAEPVLSGVGLPNSSLPDVKLACVHREGGKSYKL